jgi:hypothetical protein
MAQDTEWSRDTYESSISSRCWAYTPYDEGWEGCPELRMDDGLRRLIQQEQLLRPIPSWAQEIVERSINYPPFCPHWAFPQPYLEILVAIGKQQRPAFVHGCYTAGRGRKQRMLDYVLCLDAWLAGATADQAAAELARGGHKKLDWHHVCRSVWDVLGERSELKEHLLRRALHRQRWWVKSLVWDDDHRDVFCQDAFLGDISCTGNGQVHYGNQDFADPYFAELEVPEVKQMESRLSEICPDWPWFRSLILDSWLCGPKAFRFLERLLWCIGKEKRAVALPGHPLEDAEDVPGFLHCDDTYPDSDEAQDWVSSFARGMRSWLSEQEPDGEVGAQVHELLGDRSPMKRWLLGLYLKKMEFLNPYGGM